MIKARSFSFLAIIILLWLICSSYAGAVNLNNIVALWLFDDDDPAIVMDSSGRGHDGQVKGGAKLVDGKFGKAMQFDGSDDVIAVPDAEDLTLSSFTLAAWFNCAGPNDQWQGIVSKDSWPIRNYSLYVHRDTKTLGSNFVHNANSDEHKEVVGAKQVMDGQWHHGAATYDMNNYRIYTDGVMEKQRSVTNKPDENALPVRIGMEGAFKGMLDEVVIFNVALEADDITRMMDGMSKMLSPVESKGKLTILWGGLKKL